MVDFRKASEKCEAIVSHTPGGYLHKRSNLHNTAPLPPQQQPAKSVRLRLSSIRFLTWIAVYSSDLLMM
jgi:hypothetical protein